MRYKRNNIKPVFSIVIPVYNVEEYLSRCIQSIIQQEMDDFIEVLLVDDGSTDFSGNLCDTYAKKYKWIRTFHKSNGGLSDARNFGLEKSLGEYLVFLDSDDYLKKGSLYKLKKVIEKYKKIDVITITTEKNENNRSNIIAHNTPPYVIVSGKDYLKHELPKNMFFAAWSSVYNREFLLRNNLFFKKGILHEDEEFTPRAFLLADAVVNTDFLFYEYVIRENSITTKNDKFRNALSIFAISKDLYDIYESIEDLVLRNLLFTHNAKICYQAFEYGYLYKRSRRQYINYKLLKQCSKQNLEKFKYCLLVIHPYILHFFHKLLLKVNTQKKA